MRSTLALIVTASLVASTTAAIAQDRSDGARCTGANAASGMHDSNTAYCFGDEIVRDGLVRPDDAIVHPIRHRAGPTLLRIREHFVPEMLKSVETL